MKILIYSPKFYPSIGGLENLTLMLARKWLKMGHGVVVVTTERGDGTDCGVPTFYRPSVFLLISQFVRADVFYMPNISLKVFWLFFFSRKVVASHNGWYERPSGKVIWKDLVKQTLSKRIPGISVSRAVAERIPAETWIIPNCFDNEIFSQKCLTRKDDLLFVGRLVSDKGIDVLLKAYTLLQSSGHLLSLTIVGTGPEEEWAEAFIESNSLSQVRYIGAHSGIELSRIMNEHKVLVVPSRWAEPFGIVALEGLACGCKVVCSNKGGLPEAASNFGFYFDNGDVTGCANAILEALKGEYDQAELKRHLDSHTPEKVANEYLKVFQHSGNNR